MLFRRVIYAELQKIGIRGIQDTRQILYGKANDMENNLNKAEHSLVFDTIRQRNINAI